MTEQTIHSLIKNFFLSNSLQRLLYVGGEEWSRMLLLYGIEEQLKRLYGENARSTHFEKVSIESLQDRFLTPVFSFYESLQVTHQIVETKTFGPKERELFDTISLPEASCLVWFTDVLSEETPTSIHLQKCKPWEKETLARDVVLMLLQSKQAPISPIAVQFLSHCAVSTPSFFASNIENYCHYAADGIVHDSDIEALIGSFAAPTMWALLEPFLFRNKKAFFEGLSALEEQGETHPLPLIRFFRSQIEKLLVASESGTTLAFKSQEKQKEAIRVLSREAKRILIYELVLLDKQLRDGTFDEKSSLLPFFLSLWSRIS